MEHKKQLEEFAMLLSLLQNEMCLLRLPLELALEHAGMHLHNPYRSLCALAGEELDRRRGSAQEIWQDLLEKERREFLRCMKSGWKDLRIPTRQALRGGGVSVGTVRCLQEFF